MSHLHSIYDSDARFSINPITRKIKNEASAKTSIMQYDHDSERFTFEIPRFVEGHDMSICDKIEIHYINIAANKADQSKDVYIANDVQISPEDENVVIFSWLISGNATKYAGSLNFIVRFTCLDGEKISYAWNTAIFDGIIVSDGMNNSEAVIVNNSDVLEAWRKEILADFESMETLSYLGTKTVFLGDNVLGTATLGNGWSASGGTYTHASGSTEDLTFNSDVEEGSIYLLEFDTSYTANEFVRVGIGDRYRVLCYNGKTHIVVPLMASGGNTLYITPVNNTYAGSISNITLRKIQDEGEECVIEMYSTMTNNHTQNYGFWNTLIGDNTAENAVGSSRCIGIGHHSLAWLQGGHRNIGVGTFTMSQMLGGEENVAIGADSMIYVQKAEGCISIGFGAMSQGVELKKNVGIGRYALYGSADSTSQNNTAVGESAGFNCKGNGNSMIGTQAGYRIREGSNNTMIGANTFGGGTGSNNTVIGAGATYEDGMHCTTTIGYNAKATKSYQTVIGSHTGAWSDTKETLLFGDLVVCGTDGVYRKIVFNADGTCSWVTVNA